MAVHYRILDHTADLSIEVHGADPKNLFENAGMALMELLVGGTTPEAPTSVAISVTGQDLTDLLVRWLGEILYLFAGEDRVVTSASIRTMTAEKLEAIVEAVPFDPRSHVVRTDVKAVTYHQAQVVERGGRWVARVIFDV
jgi:SHS2 domain-containing protein